MSILPNIRSDRTRAKNPIRVKNYFALAKFFFWQNNLWDIYWTYIVIGIYIEIRYSNFLLKIFYFYLKS